MSRSPSHSNRWRKTSLTEPVDYGWASFQGLLMSKATDNLVTGIFPQDSIDRRDVSREFESLPEAASPAS